MSSSNRTWGFVTNHALVLAALRVNPDARQRDIAASIGITQGAVGRLLHELTESGHITVTRNGRRNHYAINPAPKLRHPAIAEIDVLSLIELLTEEDRRQGQPADEMAIS